MIIQKRLLWQPFLLKYGFENRNFDKKSIFNDPFVGKKHQKKMKTGFFCSELGVFTRFKRKKISKVQIISRIIFLRNFLV